MNRAWLLGAGGGGAAVAAIAAAAVWAPGILQPAGTRAELARLMARAIDQVEPAPAVSVPDDAEATEFAAQDEGLFVPLPSVSTAIASGDGVKLCAPRQVCMDPTQFQFQATGQAGARLQVVVCKVGEKRGEFNMLRREMLKKS